jgi:hypothetical protein
MLRDSILRVYGLRNLDLSFPILRLGIVGILHGGTSSLTNRRSKGCLKKMVISSRHILTYSNQRTINTPSQSSLFCFASVEGDIARMV